MAKSDSGPDKSSSPQAQLAEALADFIDRQILRKKEAFNEAVPDDLLPDLLRSCMEKSGRKTFYLSDLMTQLFRQDLNQSDTWVIASQMAVKIKNNFLVDSREWQSLHESLSPEESELLKSCAESFAGAFFNLSTDHKLQRLPQSLLSFLEAVDHRLVRGLLANDAGLKLTNEEFAGKRRDLLSTLLLDSFLIPVILNEVFIVRGILRSDRIMAAVIDALHHALHGIAPAFLEQSATNAPADVARAIAYRRISQFQQRHGGDKQLHGLSTVVSTGNSNQVHPLISPRSRSMDQRRELKNYLENLQKQLQASNVDLPEDLLKEFKQHNNQLAASGKDVDKLSAWSDWLRIARAWNSEHRITKLMEHLHAELSEHVNDQELIDKTLQKIDRHKDIVTTTAATTTTFTTSTTLATTTAATTTTLTTSVTPSRAPQSPASTTERTLNNSGERSSRGRHALTRTPRKVRESSAQSLSSSPSQASSSSSGSSDNPVRTHQRSRTADAPMRITMPGTLILSPSERRSLQDAFPELMRNAFNQIADRHPLNAIQSIVEAERNKLMLDIGKFLELLPASPVQMVRPQTVSHAELLKILVMEELISSPAGQGLKALQTSALSLIGKMPSVFSMESSGASAFVRNDIMTKVQPLAKEAVQALFGKGLKNAGLPPELRELWIKADRAITDWKNDDTLRSTMGFDLLVTRLLYPLALGMGEGSPSMAAMCFADGIRKEIREIWPDIFREFKQLSASQSAAPMPLAQPGNTQQSSSSSAQHAPDKTQ